MEVLMADYSTINDKDWLECKCICGETVRFRKNDRSVNATKCTKCKAVVLRSSIDKQQTERVS
jgi:hypothetical protein